MHFIIKDIQYCAKVLGTQSKSHLLVKCTILQDKLGRNSCNSLALGVATTRSNYYGTMWGHWPNKLVCYIWINNLTWCKNRLFDSSRCRHGLLFNLFLTSSQRYWMRFSSGFLHCHGLIDISIHGHLFSVTWCSLVERQNLNCKDLSHLKYRK